MRANGLSLQTIKLLHMISLCPKPYPKPPKRNSRVRPPSFWFLEKTRVPNFCSCELSLPLQGPCRFRGNIFHIPPEDIADFLNIRVEAGRSGNGDYDIGIMSCPGSSIIGDRQTSRQGVRDSQPVQAGADVIRNIIFIHRDRGGGLSGED